MLEKHKTIITENLNFIGDNVCNLSRLLKFLLEKKVLMEMEVEDISSKRRYDAATDLALLLKKKNKDAFPIFIECLNASGNEEIAEKLQPSSSAKQTDDNDKLEVDDVEVIKILTNDHLFCKEWKFFCNVLKFDAGTMHDLENSRSGIKDIATNIMRAWKGDAGASANLTTLSKHLRVASCKSCAEKIEALEARSKN